PATVAAMHEQGRARHLVAHCSTGAGALQRIRCKHRATPGEWAEASDFLRAGTLDDARSAVRGCRRSAPKPRPSFCYRLLAPRLSRPASPCSARTLSSECTPRVGAKETSRAAGPRLRRPWRVAAT